MSPARRTLVVTATAAAAALTLTACATSEDSASPDADTVQVLASFYPLQYITEEIGGEYVDVTNLTPPAAEPHDLELSPAQVRKIGDADLVVYLSGFQAAVDEAVEARDAHAYDAATDARLEESPNGEDAEHAGETAEEHAEHTHEETTTGEEEIAEEEPDGHDHGIEDPHFWLDPTRLADVATAVESELAEIDPEHADTYAANLETLLADLNGLDEAYTSTLADCQGATVVTSHEAFGYLAERYDLNQVGLAGVDPQTEPSPARLREVGEIVDEYGVTTIFSEVSASAKVAETFADDVGVDTAVLDPIETQADEGSDYIDVMEQNLTALDEGLVCTTTP